MALVFKIKHEETLRRWVVSTDESVNAEMFPVTLEQLQAKVRELFQFPASAVLAITYIDKDNDVVTLGGDRDLVDACVVQRLNPLRLQVQVLEWKPKATTAEDARQLPADTLIYMESVLKRLFPHMTPGTLQDFLQRYAQFLDPALPLATLIPKVQDAFKEFLGHAAMPKFHKPGPSEKPAHHHPHKHPHGDHVRGKSMPNRGEHASPKDGPTFPALHLGVQCDGCGTTPIQGPRYKSNKIPDFDLCSSCYQEKGKEGDYEKMEHPVHCPPFHDRHYYRPPYLRKGFTQFMGSHPMSGRAAFARGPYGWRPEQRAFGHDEHKKLDARFMKDVTIFDGTELAPGTKFTKIWRLCNNGSLPWPQSTQLLHIGGDVLSSQEAVYLELPQSGLACGEEVEVSVDLVAPKKAGRYTSHWRLVSPAGQKFGQRVWVTIQVVPQGEQSPMLQESLKEGEGKGKNIMTTNGTSVIEVPIVSSGEAGTLSAERKDEMMVERVAAGRSSPDVGDTKITDVGDNSMMTGTSVIEVPIVSSGETGTLNDERKDEMMVERVAAGLSAPDVGDTKITDVGNSTMLTGTSVIDVPIVSSGETGTLNAERKDEMMVERVAAGPSSPDGGNVKSTDAGNNTITTNGTSVIEVPIVSLGETGTLNAEGKDEMMVESVAASPSSHDIVDAQITEDFVDVSEELEGFALVEKPADDEEVSDSANKEMINQLELKLQSLESMGFRDRELNAVLLSKNDGNVQVTLDELLVAAGWDEALEDLQEMGFTDQAKNVRVLTKHKGSVKAAVRDLVQMGKQKA